jgi:hypothetical protein
MRHARLGAVPLADLAPTRIALHWSAQLAASVGHTLVPAREDFTHSSLRVEPALGALVGESFGDPAVRPGPRAASLVIRRFALEVEQLRFPLAGRILGEALDWLGRAAAPELAALERDSLELPGFDLPEHPVAEGAAFEAPDAHALDELANWFASAAIELESVRARHPGAPPAICWPHHFDTAVLLSVEGGAASDPDEARTIGIGMSPGDDSYAEPYWYVNPWPPPRPDDLPEIAGAGAWHAVEWVGVVLTGAELVAAGDAAAQGALLRAFLDEAIQAAHGALE